MSGDAPKFRNLQEGLEEYTRVAKALQEHKEMIAGIKESFPVCEDYLGTDADRILAPFRAALLMAEQHLFELKKKAKMTNAAMEAVP